jgi:glutamate racemase
VRIGIFDSGLGGLFVARAIAERLPQYDYLYLGDTKRVPYGNRSQATIHAFTGQALDYLFKHDCQLIILACNTASAEALRKSQQEYLPTFYPDRQVLGVVIPTAEAAIESLGLPVQPWSERTRSAEFILQPGSAGFSQPLSTKVEGSGVPTEVGAPSVGVLATASTVESSAYTRELNRCYPGTEVHQVAAPLLVPLVENDGLKYAAPVLDDYLQPMLQANVQSIILGCTHYAALKGMVRERTSAPVISTDEIVPAKLEDYLSRHPEIESKLSRGGSRQYEVTDLTSAYHAMTQRFAGEDLELRLTNIE